MICRVKTKDFHFEYLETKIDSSFLWESHCHGQYEMLAVADGDITVILEGETHRLQKNQLLIIPPLFYHSIRANGEGSYRRITVLFEKSALPEVLKNEFFQKGRRVCGSALAIEKITSICQKKDPSFYEPLLQSVMIEIFYDALQISQEPAKIETDEFLKEALGYIDQHLHEKILLDDLAKHSSRSKSSFCHLFEEKLKLSPKQYILQKKLALANKLIGEGLPPTLAALQIGYENYSNFYRIYLKHFGKAPTKKD